MKEKEFQKLLEKAKEDGVVKGKSYEDMLRIADHLIARERAANAR